MNHRRDCIATRRSAVVMSLFQMMDWWGIRLLRGSFPRWPTGASQAVDWLMDGFQQTARSRDAFLRRRLASVFLVFVAATSGYAAHFQNVNSLADPSADVTSSDSPTDDGLKSVLAIFGLDESAWRLFTDRQAFSQDEREPMSRLLHVLSRIDAFQRHQWSHPSEDWQTLALDVEAIRGQMFRVSGQVRGWERMPLPPEAAKRFGYDHFFLVDVNAVPGNQSLQVAVRELPAQWIASPLADTPRSLPVRCDVVFVKSGAVTDGKVSLVGATDRLAWFPSEPDTSWQVSPSWAELARHGMDVTLFATLDAEQRLTAQDSECFYQMLWTVRRLQLEERRSLDQTPVMPIERILAEPSAHVGQAYRANAIARRAVRVMVEDPAIQSRLGLNHYYEVECSVSLPDAVLKLRDRATGAVREYSSFPVTFCFPTLPKDFPQGDQIRQEVAVDGYFVKLWSYRSQFTEDEEEPEGQATATPITAHETPKVSLRQLSPLFVGRSLQMTAGVESQPMEWPAWILMTTIAVVIAGFALGTWLYRSKDQAFRSWRRRHGLAKDTLQPKSRSGDGFRGLP